MFSKARLDTLSEGIFGVAMTLLVLDLRLPDNFHPHDGGELLQGLAGLWRKFVPFVLSFGALGLRWLANVEIRSRAEYVNREYVNWWMLYLLLIICVPSCWRLLSFPRGALWALALNFAAPVIRRWSKPAAPAD